MSWFAELARPARHFLRWWLSELRDVVPGGLRNLLVSRRRGLVLVFRHSDAVLLRIAGSGETTVLAEIDLVRHPPGRGKALQHLIGAAHGGLVRFGRTATRTVRIRIDAHHALRTTFELPLAAEENLVEVLGFEIDRRTPFRAEDVHVAHRVEARDRRAGTLTVAITVVPRRIVQQSLLTARELGLACRSVEIAHGDDPSAVDHISLSDRNSGWLVRNRWAVRIAGTAAFTVLAATMYAGLSGADGDLEALARQVDDARAQAAKLRDLAARIAELEAEGSVTAVDRLSGNQLLLEVTRLLPDDTWLERLRLQDGKLTISGFSGSSAEIVSRLERSPLFTSPGFAAPVTQDPVTGKEAFTVTSTVGESPK